MSRRMMGTAATICLTLAAQADAHEFWIQPESYTIESGQALRLSLMHGERFRGDPVARNNGYIARFECVGAASASEVQGLDGHTTSFLRAAGEGDQVVVYHSQEYTSLLDAAKFNAYLEEEGLEAIIEARRVSGESGEPGREVYSRCAKALLDADGDGAPTDRRLGLPYEILLLPTSEGGAVEAQVLYQGVPCPDAAVVAVSQNDPSTLHEQRTDERGVVTFSEPMTGVWMLTSIHMNRLEDRHDADWESFWASLTFSAPPGAPEAQESEPSHDR